MGRKHAEPDLRDEVSLAIAAPPERLYDIVADIGRMGRLSPECTGGKWKGKAKRPMPGAVFKGTNKRGLARWSTSNTVVAAEPGREFTFDTKQSGFRWGYRFEPIGEATIVTESRQQVAKRPMSARVFTRLLLGGIEGHDDEMRAGMLDTLHRLKAVAEEPEGRAGRRRRRRQRRH
jgi:hypothetical protein